MCGLGVSVLFAKLPFYNTLSMRLSSEGVSNRENVHLTRALRHLNFDSPFE